MGRTILIDAATDVALAREVAAGGAFVPEGDLVFNDECEIVVRCGQQELKLGARVVYVDPNRGVGLEIIGYSASIRSQVTALIGTDDKPDPEETDDEVIKRGGTTMHARLRGLTLAEQIKMAHDGDLQERIVLERLYGKNIWEPLLRNPRITAPEVTRIARMGTLPKILVEAIVGNNAWLQMPDVRRALLLNPRLSTDQIVRILRVMPKPELRIVPTLTVLPHAVRDTAKRLLRGESG